MKKYKCIKCHGDSFVRETIIREYIKFKEDVSSNKIIETHNRKSEIIERIKCEDCGIYGESIEDIAYLNE